MPDRTAVARDVGDLLGLARWQRMFICARVGSDMLVVTPCCSAPSISFTLMYSAPLSTEVARIV
jgi:hypothetical protein